MWTGGRGVGAEVEAYENECLEKYPPDHGTEPDAFTDEHGRLVRRWTSNGQRIEAIIALAPAASLESLRVLDSQVGDDSN